MLLWYSICNGNGKVYQKKKKKKVGTLFFKKLALIFGIMWFRVGSLSFSSKLAWILGEGFEKTESNWLWIKWAFSTGSVVKILFLFFKSEMPVFSWFLLLIYDHSFLFEESSEKMLFKYWSWVCLQVLWQSPLIFLYFFQTLPEFTSFAYLNHLFFFLINLFESVLIQGWWAFVDVDLEGTLSSI